MERASQLALLPVYLRSVMERRMEELDSPEPFPSAPLSRPSLRIETAPGRGFVLVLVSRDERVLRPMLETAGGLFGLDLWAGGAIHALPSPEAELERDDAPHPALPSWSKGTPLGKWPEWTDVSAYATCLRFTNPAYAAAARVYLSAIFDARFGL